MVALNVPPTRRSPRFSVKVKPRGQDHCARCCGSVQALNTSARGAAKLRRRVSSRCAASFVTFACMSSLLTLQLVEILTETLEAVLPVAAIALGPVGDFLERRRLQATGARLGRATAADEAGALEHFQMLGDGRLAHGERPRQLHHAGIAGGKPRQDGTARRVGERGKGRVEAAMAHL